MHNLSVLDTHQPEWLYIAVADLTPEMTHAAWLQHQPGVRGLENAVLEHLVQSRYAAAAAYDDSWAIRTSAEVHSLAGVEHHASAAQSDEALHSLERRGLIHAIIHGGEVVGWRASTDGAAAVDGAFLVRLPHAA